MYPDPDIAASRADPAGSDVMSDATNPAPDQVARVVVIGAGQVVHPVRCSEPQGLPPELPRPAGARRAIEDHQVTAGDEPEAAQVVSHGEPRLPRTDHHHAGVLVDRGLEGFRHHFDSAVRASRRATSRSRYMVE